MKQNVLTEGSKAPNFSLKDINGKPIALESFSKAYTLVAFLRYSGCPWCNLAIHRLALEQPLLKENKCEIITVIQSSKIDIKKNIMQRHKVKPDFPIISDKALKLYKKYGVNPSAIRSLKHAVVNAPFWVHSVKKEGYKQAKIDGHVFIAPATFLIAPGSQKIIHANYNANLYEDESFSRIYKAIAHHDIYGFDS